MLLTIPTSFPDTSIFSRLSFRMLMIPFCTSRESFPDSSMESILFFNNAARPFILQSYSSLPARRTNPFPRSVFCFLVRFKTLPGYFSFRKRIIPSDCLSVGSVTYSSTQLRGSFSSDLNAPYSFFNAASSDT